MSIIEMVIKKLYRIKRRTQLMCFPINFIQICYYPLNSILMGVPFSSMKHRVNRHLIG